MGAGAVEYHLKKALEEYAASVGKPVAELNLAERNQAFYNYRLKGRQFKGAEERSENSE